MFLVERTRLPINKQTTKKKKKKQVRLRETAPAHKIVILHTYGDFSDSGNIYMYIISMTKSDALATRF